MEEKLKKGQLLNHVLLGLLVMGGAKISYFLDIGLGLRIRSWSVCLESILYIHI
jgi:hypothetical protein